MRMGGKGTRAALAGGCSGGRISSPVATVLRPSTSYCTSTESFLR